MNEQRIEAYLNLIKQLFTCPSGEEPQILSQSIELVDEGFVLVCEQVAQQLQQAGKENQAQFLQILAQQLGERVQNLELAIASFQAALQVYTREAYPKKWGMTQVNLADTLLDRFEYSRQDQELNQAIAIYREVLDSYPQHSLTLDRASILYKLGKALSRQGSYSQAIQSLEEARTLLKGQLHLRLLALTFFELGRLYHRTHRLEKARLYFKDTLRLFRRLGEQGSIADVMTELGNLELQLGQIQSASAHLEEAREYYQAKGNQERIEQIEWLLSLLGEPTEAIARG